MWRAVLLLSLTLAVTGFAVGPASTIDAAEPRVHLDIRFDLSRVSPILVEQQLLDASFEIELAVPEFGRWQGWAAAHLVDDLGALDGVLSVARPRYARFAAGQALTEGDAALNADAARDRFNVDGAGVRVAVISDGIVGLQQAQQAGEAPKLIEARAFGAGDLNRGQEGTAMIEIIHDLAPGAALSFAAVTTDLDHIAAVNHFAQRVDIIVDDVSFILPADQRSDVSVNTTSALRHPTWPLRLYVTAVGNWAESHWAGVWSPGPDGAQIGLPAPGRTHLFRDPGRPRWLLGAGNGLEVEPGDQIRVALFWSDSWGRSTNDYDLYLMSEAGAILASSETRQGVGVDNHLPREHLEYTHTGAAAALFVVIQNHNNDAGPVEFDLFAFRTDGAHIRLLHNTPEGSILAQSDAEGALTVGAVNVGRHEVAYYSSRGPTVNGALKPDIVAVDEVTVSGTTRFAPRFSGSSAAAPHVAGVAALLLQAQPALLARNGGNALLERRLIRDILIGTARDVPPAGVDPASGAGLIDADAAISAAADTIRVVNSTADHGPGTLREALNTGATILLFESTQEDRAVTLESPLPAVHGGLIIDGSDWTLDATAVEVGVLVGHNTEIWGLTVTNAQALGVLIAGDENRLVDVTLSRNLVGVRVEGEHAEIEGATVENGQSHGIEIAGGASAAISASVFDTNRGAGVRIHPAAGDVTVAPPGEPPTFSLISEQRIPIDPLDSPPHQPRSGLSHSIVGSVSVDGLPAPSGARIDLYLDRRLAASVAVDEQASFSITATGPGSELRFAVDGVPLDQRLAFESGAHTSIILRADSPMSLAAASRSDARLASANLFRNNLAGVEIMPADRAQVGRRYIWGNVMQRNRVNVSSELAAPTIDGLEWRTTGLSMRGRAEGAAAVHLYAGTLGLRRYVGAAPVIDDAFSFQHVDVEPTAREFSLIAHTALDRATPESSARTLPPRGSITSVSPARGHTDGGETLEICGSEIATEETAPKVWLGNSPARVAFWSSECVTISTPPARAGLTDIALLLPGSRPVVAADAFEYHEVRIVSLRQGWNFVTWMGPDTRVTSAFASLAGATFRAYAWDSDRQEWELFSTELPPRLNTLRLIRRDQPLWILLDTPDIDWEQFTAN